MKILLLGPDYPPEVYGGVGVHLEAVATGLVNRVKKQKFDLIHVHDHFLGLLANIIFCSTGCPLVTTIHSMKSKTSSFQDSVRRYLCKSSKKVIGVSKSLAQDIMDRYNLDKFPQVVYNGIDLDMKSFEDIKDKNLICYCGRLAIFRIII